MKRIPIQDLKAQLSAAVAGAESGGTPLTTRPLACIVTLDAPQEQAAREPGLPV